MPNDTIELFGFLAVRRKKVVAALRAAARQWW
jgi:hypothetical protein